MMNNSTEPIDTEDNLFRFETEHLALKGNEDYSEVLKTLVILSAQRQKAQEDFKSIAELRLKALDNPFEALEQLRNGTFTQIPPLMELPKLPQIDFQKYKVRVPENDLEEIYSEETAQTNNNGNNNNVKEIKKPSVPSSSSNKSWTPEEQKRLEQLLQIYPPEPVEMRRFQKIANALGNRTTHQVASRLQKYFLKLYRAGLPIPGRIPKSAEKHKKSFLHKHQRHNHYLWKPTTFFPDLNVPVQMEDSDNIPGPSSESVMMMNSASTSQNDNYLFNNVEYHQDEEKSSEINDSNNDPETQLNLLKRVRQIKELEENDADFIPYVHQGFKCDYCEETPINGARWHCTICRPPSDSVDFCTDCVISQIYTENPHPQNHWLEIILNESKSSNNKDAKSEFFQNNSENDDHDDSSSASSSSSSG